MPSRESSVSRLGRARAVVREALLDALAVVLPTECTGCGHPDRTVCDRCCARLIPEPATFRFGALTGWSALRYEGALKGIITGYKDAGRTGIARLLAPALRATAIRACTDLAIHHDAVSFVPIPSTRAAWRRRGWDPVALLMRRAGLPASPSLRHRRRVADQASLGLEERWTNRRGSLRATARVEGVRCLIVDDIATSGATLGEAARALTEAGAEVLGAVVLARTPRRDGGGEDG